MHDLGQLGVKEVLKPLFGSSL